MNFKIDRNKLYLLVMYFVMSLFVLKFVFEQPDISILALLILISFIVLSYEFLLSLIQQARGKLENNNEHLFFSAFLELNRKIHNSLKVDDVLNLVNETLKERIGIRNSIFFVSAEFFSQAKMRGEMNDKTAEILLQEWPRTTKQHPIITAEFEAEALRINKVFSLSSASKISKMVFEVTDTSLALPIIQNSRILAVLLIGRADNNKPYSDFEYKMFNYLAGQLSIILDRISIYEKVIHQTEMDHAEKMQVMESLSSNIAHEMRTPLSGIRASISGVEMYLPELLEAYSASAKASSDDFFAIRDQHLTTLKATPKRITLMIDQANAVIDMLLMNLRENSLDRKQLNICSAEECVEQAVDRYPFKSGEREKVILELKDNFSFLGVESLFVYIIFNLLKNSLYSLRSAQKGLITVTLHKGETYNVLLFRDTGEGIEKDIISRIFDGFFTTKEEGTGAGLAYCRRTILSFGGEIECRSVSGEFCEFKISLPVQGGR